MIASITFALQWNYVSLDVAIEGDHNLLLIVLLLETLLVMYRI